MLATHASLTNAAHAQNKNTRYAQLEPQPHPSARCGEGGASLCLQEVLYLRANIACSSLASSPEVLSLTMANVYSLTLTPSASVSNPPPEDADATLTESTATATTSTTATDTAKLVKARGKFTRAQTMVGTLITSAETTRLKQDEQRTANWKRWGPYLSERQWATVREDYSPNGSW